MHHTARQPHPPMPSLCTHSPPVHSSYTCADRHIHLSLVVLVLLLRRLLPRTGRLHVRVHRAARCLMCGGLREHRTQLPLSRCTATAVAAAPWRALPPHMHPINTNTLLLLLLTAAQLLCHVLLVIKRLPGLAHSTHLLLLLLLKHVKVWLLLVCICCHVQLSDLPRELLPGPSPLFAQVKLVHGPAASARGHRRHTPTRLRLLLLLLQDVQRLLALVVGVCGAGHGASSMCNRGVVAGVDQHIKPVACHLLTIVRVEGPNLQTVAPPCCGGQGSGGSTSTSSSSSSCAAVTATALAATHNIACCVTTISAAGAGDTAAAAVAVVGGTVVAADAGTAAAPGHARTCTRRRLLLLAT